MRPPSSLVAGGDDCCHVSLDAFVFLNVCLPRAILRCGAVRLNVGSIVPRGRIKTISSHKNESIVVPMGCISRPRLKHNPNDGLFCAYAYPAPYPEDTRRIPGSATRRFFTRGRDYNVQAGIVAAVVTGVVIAIFNWMCARQLLLLLLLQPVPSCCRSLAQRHEARRSRPGPTPASCRPHTTMAPRVDRAPCGLILCDRGDCIAIGAATPGWHT